MLRTPVLARAESLAVLTKRYVAGRGVACLFIDNLIHEERNSAGARKLRFEKRRIVMADGGVQSSIVWDIVAPAFLGVRNWSLFTKWILEVRLQEALAKSRKLLRALNCCYSRISFVGPHRAYRLGINP